MNEGFATLYENVFNDIIFPGKNQWETFLVEYFDVSMEVDVFGFIDPLNQPAETPAEIRRKFSFVSYFKAALVLRMFQESFTEATFVKGLTYYLLEMQFRLASPEDLYVAWQRAIDEDFPGSTVNVGDLMNTWLNFGGFPVLTVSRNGSDLVLTQQGFRTMHDELFSIPLNYATASDPNFDLTFVNLYFGSSQATLTLENAPRQWTNDDWIVFNLRDTGYYITNYDEPLWRLIFDALNDDFEAIHFLNRGTFFADMHRLLSENYDVRASLFLDLMEYLPRETNPHVWRRANLGFVKFETRLRGSRLHRMHLNYVHSLSSSVYGTTTFTDPRATNIVNYWSCLSGVENCRTDSLNALLEEMETGVWAMDQGIWYRCNGFLSANETVWMHFLNLAMDQDSSHQNRLPDLIDMLCTQDRSLLRFHLDQTLDFTNSLTSLEREAILHRAADISEAGFDTVIEFIEDNHAAINENWSLSNLLVQLSSVTNTECQAERVLYLVRFLPAGSNTDRNFFRNIMTSNLNFYVGNFDEFHDWFDNFALNNSV